MTNTPQSGYEPANAPNFGRPPSPPAATAATAVKPNKKSKKSKKSKASGEKNVSGLTLRSPLSFLRNLSIRNKMFFVALPPLLVVFLLSVLGVVDRSEEASEVGRVVTLVEFIEVNSELANNIRKEAIYSSAFLASAPEGGVGNEALAAELKTARAATDASVARYQSVLEEVQPAKNSPLAERKLQDFDKRLVNLPTTRAGIDQRQLPLELANDQYFSTSTASDQLTASLVQNVNSPQLVGELANIVNLSSLQSAISGEASILAAAEIKGGFFTKSDAICENVLSAECSSFASAQGFRARVNAAEAVFEELASPESKQEQRDVTATEQYDEKARSLYTAARNATAITPNTDAMSDTSVASSATSEIGALAGLQNATIVETKEQAESIASDAQRAVWLFAAAALAALAIAAAAAAYAAKITIDPLRRLTVAATALAEDKIPGLVQRLRDPQQSAASIDEYSQSEIVNEFDAISVESTDEIGQLADAFRSIQEVTVDVAEKQNELLRKGIGDIFVNLARRNQVLLDRQIKFIEKMEAGEEDPDQLSNLFKLDHLATRMRRNAESLLVLAGAEQNRGRRDRVVAISDVIRVGMGEVEDFQRVRIGAMDPVNVPGNVAVDVAHLVGELIENATQFSPPDSFVEIDGHLDHMGSYYMRIMDHGIGMDATAIGSANELLANPPFMGLEISRSLGFIVVGRLAARFNIRVHLNPNSGGGIIATVTLPPEALLSTSVTGSNFVSQENVSRGNDSAAIPVRSRQQPPHLNQPSYPAQPVTASYPGAPPVAAPAQQSQMQQSQMQQSQMQQAQVQQSQQGGMMRSGGQMPSLSQVPDMPQPVISTGNHPALPRRRPKVAPAAFGSPAPQNPVNQNPVNQNPANQQGSPNVGTQERNPEQVRSMLSRYQAGIQRGREENLVSKQGVVESSPPAENAPPPKGSPVRLPPRASVSQSARTPEEVRETLMRYRSGLTRGKQDGQ